MNHEHHSDELHLQRMAEDGDMAAQIFLGWAYSKHGNMMHDPERAEKFLRMAVTSGQIDGRRALARFLFDYGRAEAVGAIDMLVAERDYYGYFLKGQMLAKLSSSSEIDKQTAILALREAASQGHIISGLDALKLEYKRPILHPSSWSELWRLSKQFFQIWRRDSKDWRISR